jgi:hypothetical protein
MILPSAHHLSNREKSGSASLSVRADADIMAMDLGVANLPIEGIHNENG